MTKRVAWVGIAVVAAAVGLAVRYRPRPASPAAEPVASQTTPASPAPDGIPAPEVDRLSLTDLHGQKVSLASFKGKVVILNFWATWCVPCKVEIPDLLALQAEHPNDLAVVGIVVLDPISERTPKFVADMKMTYPILDGNDRQDVEAAYGPFVGLPTSVILDREGYVVTKRTGAASKQMFADAIEPLLKM
jgi:thiol-disulfide isomerase/thioredoxin